MPENTLPEPWRSFMRDLDAQLEGPTELHCLGGFVIEVLYDATRSTADVDVIEVRGTHPEELVRLAGKDSALRQRHRIWLDLVTVATVPEHYEDRLIAVQADVFTKLRLRAFERHDLVLAKLTRNVDRDREDVRRLAVTPGLDVSLLRERYQLELRPLLGHPDREDLTLELWIEIIQEVQQRQSRT